MDNTLAEHQRILLDHRFLPLLPLGLSGTRLKVLPFLSGKARYAGEKPIA
jgi:hypothetical protein